VVGDTVGVGDLLIYETAGRPFTDSLAISVEGPFVVEGSSSPLGADEERQFRVRYTGASDKPVIALGRALFTADGQSAEVGLAAVVGRSGLGEVRWTQDGYGRRGTIALLAAPFPHPSASYTDATVLIAIPPGLTAHPAVDFVFHFHGMYARVASTVASQYLVEQHALSGRDAVFVAPQGPLNAGNNNFGKLLEPDGLRNLADEVITLLYRDGFIDWPALGEAVLTAHSGGYVAAAVAGSTGGIPVLAIQLYDSLYNRVAEFAALVEAGVLLRSNYTATAGTTDENLLLREQLEAAGIVVGNQDSDAALSVRDVVITATRAIHTNCMWLDRVVRALDSAERLAAPAFGPSRDPLHASQR
jgi:hypothetical protein